MMELALTSVPVGMISMHDLVSFICGFIVGTTEMTPWKLKDDDILYKIGNTWGFKDAFAFGLDARRKLVEHRLARVRNAK